jgi:hypothetical protein
MRRVVELREWFEQPTAGLCEEHDQTDDDDDGDSIPAADERAREPERGNPLDHAVPLELHMLPLLRCCTVGRSGRAIVRVASRLIC